MSEEKETKKGAWKKYWLLVLLGLVIVVAAVLAIPLVQAMMDPHVQERLQDWVSSLGVWGVLALFGIQILQIVVAFLPGEPVELVAGTMYGAWGGLTICLTGVLLGSAVIFLVVRRIGRSKLMEGGSLRKKMEKYQFLQNARKLDTLIFILYLIPGTPKDVLVYVCALTQISLGRFLFLSTLARIPSVVSSTWAGSAFASGNMGLTLAIFLVTGILGILGISFHDRFVGRKNQEIRRPDKKD